MNISIYTMRWNFSFVLIGRHFVYLLIQQLTKCLPLKTKEKVHLWYMTHNHPIAGTEPGIHFPWSITLTLPSLALGAVTCDRGWIPGSVPAFGWLCILISFVINKLRYIWFFLCLIFLLFYWVKIIVASAYTFMHAFNCYFIGK